MELKFRSDTRVGVHQHSFNRTFMELKFKNLDRIFEIMVSFNRTFMELKWGLLTVTKQIIKVSIVPLWN